MPFWVTRAVGCAWRKVGLIAALALLCPQAAGALDVPALSGRVVDRAGLLDAATRSRLEQKLAAFEGSSGHQLAVLIVPSLEGDPIEDFSIRVVEQWRLGGKEHDNGALLLIAQDDRKVRIEVGYGLEGALTDAQSSRIIREVIAPAFRQQDFAGGVDRAVTAMMQAARGEEIDVPGGAAGGSGPSAGSPQGRRRGGGLPWWVLLLLVFVAPPAMRWLGLGMLLGGMGHRGGYGGRGGFGGGFGGGGFGGGGFSGGGGGFGGGGASGGW